MTRILVVEDEQPSRAVINKALTRLGGYEVIFTEEVEAALRLTRSGEVALVVMDVALSNTAHEGRPVDGLAFTRLLKADPLSRNVPVLLTTAYALRGDGERLCAESGAEGYIAKPFRELGHLADKVRSMLAAG